MLAHVGDRLVVDGDPERTGIVIEVPHADGTPPYVVRWLATGHIALVSPGQFARLIPGDQPDQAGQAGITPVPQDRG